MPRVTGQAWEVYILSIAENPTKIDTDRPVVHRKIRHCEIEWLGIEEWEKVGKRGYGRVEIFFINALPHDMEKAENFSGAVSHVVDGNTFGFRVNISGDGDR